jgi:hypothetical protein
MRYIFSLTLTIIALNACEQGKVSRMTVIFFDNQNPNSKLTVDTLIKAKGFNFSDTPIDLFFTSRNFHLPYYVPTEGIYKNAAKDKECDMKIYPATVRCYEYDDRKRVVKMTVSGSGTMNNFTYKYNDKNQITEITDFGTKFTLTYNNDGTLSELKQTIPFDKRLIFVYE